MLVVTRGISKVIRISDNVQVVVLGVRGNQVSIGVVAPREISVYREEVYQRIQQEKSGMNKQYKNRYRMRQTSRVPHK